jgi:hypothetical protein
MMHDLLTVLSQSASERHENARRWLVHMVACVLHYAQPTIDPPSVQGDRTIFINEAGIHCFRALSLRRAHPRRPHDLNTNTRIRKYSRQHSG